MRLFIPSYGRADTISSHNTFGDLIDYLVVVHTDKQRREYISKSTVPAGRIIVSNVKQDQFGLTRQREWICDNLVARGEWFMFADDDIRHLSALPMPWYEQDDLTYVYKVFPDTRKNRSYSAEWRKRFDTPPSRDYFHWILEDMIDYAEELCVPLCGFGTTDNYFFRSVKFKTVQMVIGPMQLVKNLGIPWDHTITMEDYERTADHLFRFGRVLVNNYVYPKQTMFRSGGMGSLEKRTPERLRDSVALMERWPGLFRHKNLRNKPKNTDLALKVYGEDGIAAWRQQFRQPVEWGGD